MLENEDKSASSNRKVGALSGSLAPGLFGEFVFYYHRWINSPGYEYAKIRPEFKERLLSAKDKHPKLLPYSRIFFKINLHSLFELFHENLYFHTLNFADNQLEMNGDSFFSELIETYYACSYIGKVIMVTRLSTAVDGKFNSCSQIIKQCLIS